MEEIRVCHCNHKTPLIWTYKFPGAEYWCPSCGYTSGMFGAGVKVELTEEIKELREYYEVKTRPYLYGETNEWEYE